MALDKITQTFTKGYSGDASPFVLDLTQVSAVKNMLFERGLLISRPGLTTLATGLSNAFPYSLCCPAEYLQNLGILTYTDGLANANTPIKFKPISLIMVNPGDKPLAESGLTTSGTALVAPNYQGNYIPRACLYEQQLIIGPLGLIKTTLAIFASDPTAYTLITTPVPFAYSCAHSSRLIGIAGVAYPAPQPNVYWSKINDPTTWTGDFTTGNAALPDAEDPPTVAGVMRSILVIGRKQGFHLGMLTGNGSNPYDFKCMTKQATGVVYPDTFQIYNDIAYFLSDSDVSTYDLSQTNSLGEGVVTELFSLIRAGYCPHAFITRTYKQGGFRPQYHVFLTYKPTTNTFAMSGIPPATHFCYDITEQKWSRHVYDAFAADALPSDGFILNYNVIGGSVANNTHNPMVASTVGIFRQTIPFSYAWWDYNVPCESAQSFTTGRIQIDDPTEEFKIVRMLVVANCSANATACNATYNSFLGNASSSQTIGFTLNTGWNRVWVNAVRVGQFFTVKIDVPAGVYVEFRQLVLVHETSAQEVRV